MIKKAEINQTVQTSREELNTFQTVNMNNSTETEKSFVLSTHSYTYWSESTVACRADNQYDEPSSTKGGAVDRCNESKVEHDHNASK